MLFREGLMMNDLALVAFLICWSLFTGFLMAIFCLFVLGGDIDDDDDDNHWCH